MAGKIVNVYIDDTSIRLLVYESRKVTKWGNVKLESGLVQNNVIADEQKVAEAIRQLLESHGVKANKVNIGISGLGCLTRPALFPLLPKEVLREAIEREAARVLPVPLEQLYLSWQVIPSSTENTEAFIVAIPRKIIDSLVRTLRLANLKFQFLGLKPLLQAGTSKEETSVIVDIQENEFDIVVISGGKPQPVRTMSFPGASTAWEEKLSSIADELERTISFFNANSQKNPLNNDIPLFVSGAVNDADDTLAFLSERLDRQVERLVASVDCPEDIDTFYYSVNLAMVYNRIREKKEPPPLVISLNILPEEFHIKAVSMSHILPVPVGVIMVGALLFLFLLTQSIATENKSVQAKIENTNLLLVQRQAESIQATARIRELQEFVDANQLLIGNYTETLEYIDDKSQSINRYLDTTVSGIKNFVTLHHIDYSDEKLTIQGQSTGVLRISTFLKEIFAHQVFSDIESLKIVEDDNDKMIFTVSPEFGTESKSIQGITSVLSLVPSDVSITDLDFQHGKITVSGKANGEEPVLSFLHTLDELGLYSEIHILSMILDESEGLVFSATIVVGD